MADNNTVARPYARAVFEVAQENDALGELSESLAVAKTLLADGQVTEFLAARHIVFTIDEDGETITVSISEDEDDELIEQAEGEYDRLLDLSREQTDQDEGEHDKNYQNASLLITLKDGARSYAHVDTDLVNRILRNISTEELNGLVESIVDAVENPDDRSFCQTLRDSEKIQE